MNTDDEKSISGSFTKGKDIYRAESKVLTKKAKGAISYNASTHMQYPRGELISAFASYENNKHGLNGKVYIDKIVKSPIILAGKNILQTILAFVMC